MRSVEVGSTAGGVPWLVFSWDVRPISCGNKPASPIQFCEVCQSPFAQRNAKRHSKYCSEGCRWQQNLKHAKARRAALPKKPRALLSAKYPCTCEVCGHDFMAKTAKARICGKRCGNAKYLGLTVAPFQIMNPRPCLACGARFKPTVNWRAKFCSKACREKSPAIRTYRAKARVLRRELVADGDDVDPFYIFERDKWTCNCCGAKSSKSLRGKRHPRAPHLDHIMPVSKGGEHTKENLQLLCRTCNLSKNDGSANDQLLLIG